MNFNGQRETGVEGIDQNTHKRKTVLMNIVSFLIQRKTDNVHANGSLLETVSTGSQRHYQYCQRARWWCSLLMRKWISQRSLMLTAAHLSTVIRVSVVIIPGEDGRRNTYFGVEMFICPLQHNPRRCSHLILMASLASLSITPVIFIIVCQRHQVRIVISREMPTNCETEKFSSAPGFIEAKLI